MKTADDIENERRGAIFDAGREAKRKGFGPGKNPHWDGLDSQIWRNGWNWEDEPSTASTLTALIVGVLVILAIATAFSIT